ncbi:hypothetical protein BDQ17DRAFT_615622 [Cyathus striatus]|nr:hypothetical protein BDQ17DRAFT_615622 [Cyathus striatus]
MTLFPVQGSHTFNLNGGAYYDTRLTAVLNTATYEQFMSDSDDDDGNDVSGITYEAAENTFWILYNAQAETLDSGVINRWRGNMDSILIFAGLFSAVLTAFIAEAFQFDTTSDTTPVSVLVGNCLWFVSLGFSLVAALGAIIIQQWSRSYELKTQHQGTPKNCVMNRMQAHEWAHKVNMDRIVASIPRLLHVSLLLFYVGSVAFFKQYNVVIFILNIITLGIVSGIYMLLAFGIPPRLPRANQVKNSYLLGIWTSQSNSPSTKGYTSGWNKDIDDHMYAVGELIVKLVLYQTIRENNLEDFLCVLHVLLNHARRDISDHAMLFGTISIFSKRDIFRELLSNVRHWLRTYESDNLSVYEKEKRIKACAIVAPIFVIGLSTRVMESAVRKHTADVCLDMLRCCEENHVVLYHRISSVGLVVKSAMAKGWRARKYIQPRNGPAASGLFFHDLYT